MPVRVHPRHPLKENPQMNDEKKVPCEFEGCPERIPFNRFDESIHLPVFKATREHMGFFCERHVAELRAGRLGKRYILSRSGPDEIIIDMEPLPPKDA